MPPPLKIIQISLGDGFAGSHRFALLSSVELARRGHEIRLIVSQGSLTEKRGLAAGLEVRPVPQGSGPETKEAVGAWLDKEKPQTVVAHHSLERKILMRLRLRGRAPYRTFAFRNIVSRSFPLLSAIPYNLLLDGQIACSKGVARSLYRDGAFPWKVSVVYNGISVPYPLPPAVSRKSLGDSGGSALIGMSAWFHPKRKGFDTAFKALAPGLGRPFRLVLIGVAPEHEEPARRMAQDSGLDPQTLVFPGYVEDVFPLYQALDVFILPSREEGFSLSLLEAMTCEKPCVVSDIPGNDEAIQQDVTGLKFRVSRFKELRQRLMDVLGNPEMARGLGQEARRVILQRFTVAYSAADLERVLLGSAL